MRALLVLIELVIRSGIMLGKILLVALGVTVVVSVLLNPSLLGPVILVISAVGLAWVLYDHLKHKNK